MKTIAIIKKKKNRVYIFVLTLLLCLEYIHMFVVHKNMSQKQSKGGTQLVTFSSIMIAWLNSLQLQTKKLILMDEQLTITSKVGALIYESY